jgi:hypothetical protein
MEKEDVKMKKYLFIMISLVLAAGLAVYATKAESPALLTVEGKVKGGSCNVDKAMFEKNSVELTINDPWKGNGSKYKGILVKKLLELCEADADTTTVSLTAKDGKSVDVAVTDAQKWDIVLVHWADGTVLAEKAGGPVKIAFPKDAAGTYKKEQWLWWLKTAKIE